KTPVAELKDFDECFLKAQVEMMRAREANSKLEQTDSSGRTALQQERDEHRRLSVEALARALTMVDAKTPTAKIDDVRFYLTAGYLASGDLYRGAIAAEGLARGRPPSKRASTAAAYGIQTYAALVRRDSGDDGARLRLKDLAEFALSPENTKVW